MKTERDSRKWDFQGGGGGEKKKKDLSNELQKEEEEEGEQNCLDLSSQIVYVSAVSWYSWSYIELLYRPPSPINIILSLIKLV